MVEEDCDKNKIDIAVLKSKVDKIDKEVIDMTSNHLPHIYNSINELKVQMAYYVGIGTTLVIISQVLLSVIF